MMNYIYKYLILTFCLTFLCYFFIPRYETVKESGNIARFDRFTGEYEVIGNDMQWIKITEVRIGSPSN
jgi:hypothetical protein